MDDSKLKLKIRDGFERQYTLPSGYNYDFQRDRYTDKNGQVYVMMTVAYHEYVKGYFKCLKDLRLRQSDVGDALRDRVNDLKQITELKQIIIDVAHQKAGIV
jgi:hypothetical protein